MAKVPRGQYQRHNKTQPRHRQHEDLLHARRLLWHAQDAIARDSNHQERREEVIKFIQRTFANGRSQPPRNRVVATEATTIMFVYSDKKYSDQRKPLNSVI